MTADTDDRTSLLDRVRQGDRDALGEILESYRPYIRVIVRSVPHGPAVRSPTDDSDLIQETVMQASRCAASFQGNTLAEWLGWLRTIALRTTRRTLYSAAALSAGEAPRAELETVVVARDSSPADVAIRNENATRMALALSRLPDDMQQVLLGRVVHDHDHSEIAGQLGRSPEAVRQLYVRALRRLKELWHAEFSSESGMPL